MEDQSKSKDGVHPVSREGNFQQQHTSTISAIQDKCWEQVFHESTAEQTDSWSRLRARTRD